MHFSCFWWSHHPSPSPPKKINSQFVENLKKKLFMHQRKYANLAMIWWVNIQRIVLDINTLKKQCNRYKFTFHPSLSLTIPIAVSRAAFTLSTIWQRMKSNGFSWVSLLSKVSENCQCCVFWLKMILFSPMLLISHPWGAYSKDGKDCLIHFQKLYLLVRLSHDWLLVCLGSAS